MPGNLFKAFWNSVIIFLLVYTATYMPYKTCFIDTPSNESKIFDQVIDGLFTIDIFINFISAVEMTDGSVISSLKDIAADYARSWFIFDVAAVFPVELILDTITHFDES
jgi:hypothetical protein